MNEIVAMLPVASMPLSVEFYESLGFGVETRSDEWGWAMLRLDGCRLMVDESIGGGHGASRFAVVYFYPADVVEFHAGLRESGIDVPDLGETFYGLTEFRVVDPDGNRLWIGQRR